MEFENELDKVQNMDIWIYRDDGVDRCKASLLELKKLGEKSLILDRPTLKGSPVSLKYVNGIQIFFTIGDHTQLRTYWPEIVNPDEQYQLAGGNATPAIAISYPEEIKTGQRREFYRLRISPFSPVPIKFATTDDEVFEGIIRNISGGGVGFKLSKDIDQTLELDTELLVQFQLPGQNSLINLFIAIRFRVEKEKDYLLGAEFVNVTESKEYINSVQAVLDYVLETQRGFLRNKGHV